VSSLARAVRGQRGCRVTDMTSAPTENGDNEGISIDEGQYGIS
jgi:hypothetical protein